MVTLFENKISFRGLVKIGVVGIWVLACTATICSAVEVAATLDRDSVPAGNGAVLTLRISGAGAGAPVLPEVENLIVQAHGQRQQMQMIDGQTTISVIYEYVVGSNTPGDYQIPPFEVSVDGKKYPTQLLKLKVLDSNTAQAPAGNVPNSPGTQPAGEEAVDTGEKRFGFLTVELAANERKHAYVGEIAPVRIRAWLPADSRAQLRSGIQPEGKAFTLHNVSDQPQQTQEIKDGKRYLVVTWFGGMSATKAGKYPVSLSLDANVAVRDKAALKQPRRRRGGPFDDPFFDNVFDQMDSPMIQKDVTLKSDDQEIEVRPLPTEGRPEGFTGAVGEFKFDRAEIPNDWKTGEPQQITARLSGSGNFVLMKAPELSPADGWKSYSGKDEFTAGDQASFSGSKMFQFSAVPRKGGAQEVALIFSYFDPAAEQYKTLTSSLKKIQVTGEAVVELESAVTPVAGEPEKKTELLVAQHLELSPRGTLLPLVSRPAFILMLAISGVLGILGIILAMLRIRRENPQRRARATLEKAIGKALDTAQQCVVAGDVAGFFAAARLAIQQRLGALWDQPAQAITLAEIAARIGVDSPVACFFREADAYQYNCQVGGGILPQWRSLFDDAMASITPLTR